MSDEEIAERQRMLSLDECVKPAFDALADVRRIAEERRQARLYELAHDKATTPRRVFDSGWYCRVLGKPLPGIDDFLM